MASAGENTPQVMPRETSLRNSVPLSGLVIKNTGSGYRVQMPDGHLVNCKVKGHFRLKGIRTTNPVAVGDRVEVSEAGDGTGYITAIEPRANYIIRRASNLSKEAHILAANISQAMLIVTVAAPETSAVFMDRFLATAEAYSVPAVLVFNKADIYTPEERETAMAYRAMYEEIGYATLEVSAVTGQGVDCVRALLSDKITLLSGNSGVGKSSLINALIPGLDLKVGEISAVHHKGMHTTTFSEMYPLPGGGYIIDTPGIKGFGTIDFNEKEVAHYFPEIFRISGKCRFADCTHRNEPGCAVLEAIERQEISMTRYASYLSILDDITQGKYRAGY